MPTPASLASLIEANRKDFNPAVERDEYVANRPAWQLYLDLLELDPVKIRALLDKHDSTESAGEYTHRQNMAACVNLIPSIVGMIRNYIFSEEPQIDVGEDADLADFLGDCDGRGTTYRDFIKNQILPLAVTMGFIDVLIQNTADDEPRPVVVPYTPLQRVNWSCAPGGTYQWVCFRDVPLEDPNPLLRRAKPRESYITLSAATPELTNSDAGYWIASQKDDKGQWRHTADFIPMARAPVATLYYQPSIDPQRPHFGVSKIAMMAVLTRVILQVLSWTVEDIESNLAVLSIPTRDGGPPVDERGQPIAIKLTSKSILFRPADSAGAMPAWVQGDVDHIKIKMELVGYLVREVLRCAHLLGAGSEEETISSGRQGEVMRNELFQELAALSVGLDSFTADALAMVKSWRTGEEWDGDDLAEIGVLVNFNKSNWTIDPLQKVAEECKAVLDVIRDYSPTLSQAMLEKLARSALYAADRNLPIVLDEIRKHGAEQFELQQEMNKALLAGHQAANAGGEDAEDA